jgi:hypothetical protein
MGGRHHKRPYNKKLYTDKSIRTSASSSLLPDKLKEYAGVFQRSTAFDKHITELHEKIFLSINSDEYICALCPCNTIAHGNLHCTARFNADIPGGRQTFMDHLRSHHAQNPNALQWYHHACLPKNTASYTDAKIRRAAESLFD